MRIGTPYEVLSPWPSRAARRLFKRQNRPPRDTDDIVTAFRDGEVTLRKNRRTEGFTNAIAEHGYQGVRAGDLVIYSMDGFAGAIGVSDSDGKASPVVHCYQPSEDIDPRFYAYLLRDAARAEFIMSLAKGIRERSTAFDSETFRSLMLPVPNFRVQRAIVDFLDAETARIDALIEKKRRMLSLLEERDRKMIDECFAPRSDERLVRLARFAKVQTGVTLHEGRTLDGDAVTLPYLRVANVQPGRLDLSEVKSVTLPKAMALRSRLRSGDVLMTEGGDIDKLGRGTVWRGEISNCLHQNHVFAVRANPLSLDSGYLAHLTRTSHARAYFEMAGVQSTNLASTSASKVADFRIPALLVDEQRARVNRYQRFATKNKMISAALKNQLALLSEHRQALITAAVTGQLKVPGGRSVKG